MPGATCTTPQTLTLSAGLAHNATRVGELTREGPEQTPITFSAPDLTQLLPQMPLRRVM
jgi:hypothetical protein